MFRIIPNRRSKPACAAAERGNDRQSSEKRGQKVGHRIGNTGAMKPRRKNSEPKTQIKPSVFTCVYLGLLKFYTVFQEMLKKLV